MLAARERADRGFAMVLALRAIDRPWSWLQHHARGVSHAVWLTSALLATSALFLDILIVLGHAPGGALSLTELFFSPGTFILASFGALIIAHRPQHIMGWLFCLSGLLGTLTWLMSAYEEYAGAEPLPLLALAAWIQAPIDIPYLLILFLIVPYLFPSGRLLSPRWSPLLVLAILITGLTALAGPLTLREIGTDDRQEHLNPTYLPAVASVFDIIEPLAIVAILVTLFGAVASLGVRYRRSRGVERLQMRWLSWMLGVTVALALLFLLVESVEPAWVYTGEDWSPFGIALVVTILLCLEIGLPTALGLSILRYRLYSLDLLIHRALVYLALTACIVVLYAVIVGYLGSLFQTGESFAISLVATAVVAVLFQPLREQLQRGVSRLLYGERDEPYTVLTRLGRRLEETLAPEAVLPAIVGTVREALKLPYVAVALRQGEHLVTAAAIGTPVKETLRLPLIYQQEPVGELHLAPRAPGEAFDVADRRLLDDLARQAGVAAHAVQLTAALQRSRERLVAAREEERRRLRRDLHDGLGPLLGSLTLKIDVADDLLERDPATAHALLRDLRRQSQTAIADIRRLVYALRPPALDELGLVDALRAEAAQYEPTGLDITVQAPDQLPSLPAAVEVAAYRITLEALTNVVRHAGARRCTIRLSLRAGALDVVIDDDGRGLPRDVTHGVGFASMSERAEELGGTWAVTSSTGGTQVRASLPVEHGIERELSPDEGE